MSATRRRTRARRKAMERGRFAEFMRLSRPALERLARDAVGVPDVTDARWVDGVLHVTLTTRAEAYQLIRERVGPNHAFTDPAIGVEWGEVACVKNDT